MKIVAITHNYIRRKGDLTALYLHRLSSGLVKKGLQITVLCPHAPGLLRNDNIDGVRIIRFGYPFSQTKPIVYTGGMHEMVAGSLFAKIVFLLFIISFYREALKLCRREKPELIWANWWIPPGLVAARIAAKLKLPLVISSHGTDIALLDRGGIIGKLSRYVYKRTAKASVVSSFLKEKLRQRVGILGEADIAVIPMPVGMENFPKAAPPQNNIPLLLSVARFTRQKHLADIIAAADLVAEENVAFKILMVGEGQLEDELKNLVQQKGLTQNIEFLPLVAQQKLGKLYRQCDAVILVSENEGFGLVLVEAGLTGRPAIASRSGGITDIVEDGVSGILVELGDVNAIARIMKKLFQDSNLRSRLGEGAYRRAMGTFATPVLVNKIYELFKSVILI